MTTRKDIYYTQTVFIFFVGYGRVGMGISLLMYGSIEKMRKMNTFDSLSMMDFGYLN